MKWRRVRASASRIFAITLLALLARANALEAALGLGLVAYGVWRLWGIGWASLVSGALIFVTCAVEHRWPRRSSGGE